MRIGKATARYETWMADYMVLAEPDLKLKHQQMRGGLFPFLRATFYRWAQIWPTICSDLTSAPVVLADSSRKFRTRVAI